MSKIEDFLNADPKIDVSYEYYGIIEVDIKPFYPKKSCYYDFKKELLGEMNRLRFGIELRGVRYIFKNKKKYMAFKKEYKLI